MSDSGGRLRRGRQSISSPRLERENVSGEDLDLLAYSHRISSHELDRSFGIQRR
ncbi:hypothetical protein TIFTF001_048033 [Ficus carica]|uniref:Uncharacterized protein n=1 Tax=Ficus carica TaxID=3494 RepID=A0AA87ZXB5_FICCA|nr:hypothetical protein TIFTF001_048033 [Ficus carica]